MKMEIHRKRILLFEYFAPFLMPHLYSLMLFLGEKKKFFLETVVIEYTQTLIS